MKIKTFFQFLNENYSSNNISDEELYIIAKWGLENDYADSVCWEDNEGDIEGAIECVMNSFRKFISIPYPKELGNIPENPIIYRLIRLKNIEDLNKDKLGISWFSNPNQIENPEFFDMLEHLKFNRNLEGHVYMLKAIINKDNIDIANTL